MNKIVSIYANFIATYWHYKSVNMSYPIKLEADQVKFYNDLYVLGAIYIGVSFFIFLLLYVKRRADE